MSHHSEPTITAFVGDRRIATGRVVDVVRRAKAEVDRGVQPYPYLFDDRTGARVDMDFEGEAAVVADRAEWLRASLTDEPDLSGQGARGRGRPRLGVVSKEVTLLPRHWAWLNAQRGSISATLRRLVDEARKSGEGADRVRASQDAAYRFMHDAAGDAPGFEEAMRALYARNHPAFDAVTQAWSPDVRDYARKLAADTFSSEETT